MTAKSTKNTGISQHYATVISQYSDKYLNFIKKEEEEKFRTFLPPHRFWAKAV